MSELLDTLAHTRAQVIEAIAGLDEAALDQNGLIGTWSIKNLLAHLAAWEEWAVQVLLEALPTGVLSDRLRAPFELGFDAWNATQVAERHELSPDEQLVELERVRQALVEAVGALDPATLAAQTPWQEGDETIADFVRIWADHDDEHLPDIRAAARRLQHEGNE
jgi:hypothetical protein